MSVPEIRTIPDIQYATVKKQRKDGQVFSVETEQIHGKKINWKTRLICLQFPIQSIHRLWNDRMVQIDISMHERLLRHWSFQRTKIIMSVIAGFVHHTTISVGIMELFVSKLGIGNISIGVR